MFDESSLIANALRHLKLICHSPISVKYIRNRSIHQSIAVARQSDVCSIDHPIPSLRGPHPSIFNRQLGIENSMRPFCSNSKSHRIAPPVRINCLTNFRFEPSLQYFFPRCAALEAATFSPRRETASCQSVRQARARSTVIIVNELGLWARVGGRAAWDEKRTEINLR